MHSLKWIIAFYPLVFTLGCQQNTPAHPWVNMPEGQQFTGPWTVLPDASFIVLDKKQDINRCMDAIEQLNKSPVIAITDTELAKWKLKPTQWHGTATTQPAQGLHAYLVRGVSYGQQSIWCRVWIDPTGRILWIHHGSYDGESALGVIMHKLQPSPVIVFLPQSPEKVYATAVLGGDNILAGPPSKPAPRRLW